MTSTTENGPVPAECVHETTITLSSGAVFCPVCRTEWEPGHEPAHEPARVITKVDEEPYESEVAYDEETGNELPPDLDALIGTEVMTRDFRVAMIRGFPDDDHVLLEFPTGRKAVLENEDVLTAAERAAHEAPDDGELNDEQAVVIGRASLSVAGLMLQAGLASLADEGSGYRMLMPPSGWIVPEVDALPVVELGGAYAVATLIAAFELPRAQVEAFARVLLTDAQEPIKTTEER